MGFSTNYTASKSQNPPPLASLEMFWKTIFRIRNFHICFLTLYLEMKMIRTCALVWFIWITIIFFHRIFLWCASHRERSRECSSFRFQKIYTEDSRASCIGCSKLAYGNCSKMADIYNTYSPTQYLLIFETNSFKKISFNYLIYNYVLPQERPKVIRQP